MIVGQFAGEVLVLAQASLDIPALTEAIHAQVGNLRVAVSGVQHGVSAVALAHSQCRDALLITQRLADARSTVHFDQLGYLHTLFHAGTSALDANPYVPAVRNLYGEGQTDLLHTLEVYLDAGGNGVQAAEVLCIHRSTLNYRLTRIEEVCGIKLNAPQVRTNLQVALKLLRLFEDETE
jgi:PucR family transcriptional regulator, purine catabolism regulatory protein